MVGYPWRENNNNHYLNKYRPEPERELDLYTIQDFSSYSQTMYLNITIKENFDFDRTLVGYPPQETNTHHCFYE